MKGNFLFSLAFILHSTEIKALKRVHAHTREAPSSLRTLSVLDGVFLYRGGRPVLLSARDEMLSVAWLVFHVNEDESALVETVFMSFIESKWWQGKMSESFV